MTDPRPPMLTVRQALERMLAAARPLQETETVETIAANGRVLALAQHATLAVPPMDNTQMDGYAVRVADCVVEYITDGSGAAGDDANGEGSSAGNNRYARLPVSARIAAGQVPQALLPGSAARIFTGAMIPAGADVVVMQEQCSPEKTPDGDFVTIAHRPLAGEWIRRAGEDIRAGAEILAAGTRLGPAQLGLAASVGLDSLPVKRKLRVAMFFTGDELTMPGEPLAPGAIYNSNRYTLRGLLENLDCEIADYGSVPDTLEATRLTLRQAAQQNDLVITSGGVSVGEEDHVRPAVQAEGRLDLWQIAVKPGRPLAFGEIDRQDGSTFFIGLPGNPVSSFVTFLLFVRPFILRLQGVTEVEPVSWTMRADFSWPKADKRNEFLRVRLNAEGGLERYPHQGSGVLTSMAWGDGLVDNAPGVTIAPGDLVRYLPFSGLLS